MQGNRYKISKQNRVALDKIKESKIMGNRNNFEAKNKDVFLYAVALGKDFPSDLTAPDQWFEEDDLTYEEKAIVYSIAFDVFNDVDKLLKFDEVRPVLDRMSNSGISNIVEKISEGGLDNIEKRMISELDELYNQLSL